jgi:hypothetical protein
MELLQNGKSANQIWKESGTTLSFADWIQREKEKGNFLPNKMVSDITEGIKSSLKNTLGIDDSSNVNSNTPANTSNRVVGLNKWVIVGSLVVIAGAIVYSVVKKKK